MTTTQPGPDRAHPDPHRPDVRRTGPDDRAALERLWLLFRHDLSEITGELPGPDGRFRDERLRTALGRPGPGDGAGLDGTSRPAAARSGVRAYLATAGAHPVAFALVRGLDGPVRVLSAFFVVRAARRHGVGRRVAAAVLADVPGRWEVPFQDANQGAAAFWPRVATDVTGERWSVERRAVPGRPDLPPDAWLALQVR